MLLLLLSRQGVELKICRKAIDRFYIGFRDQLTSAVSVAYQKKMNSSGALTAANC